MNGFERRHVYAGDTKTVLLLRRLRSLLSGIRSETLTQRAEWSQFVADYFFSAI